MKKISKFIINNKTKVLIISCILLVLSFIGMKLTTINYNILVYLPSEIDTIKGQDILTDEFNMGSYYIVAAENLSPKEILNLKKYEAFKNGYRYSAFINILIWTLYIIVYLL